MWFAIGILFIIATVVCLSICRHSAKADEMIHRGMEEGKK